MIDIRPLPTISQADIDRIMPGYTTTEKMVVGKTESLEQTVITLRLVTLKRPYAKKWDSSEDEIRRYQAIVAGGLSLGVYDGGLLIAFAIVERRDWNRVLWIWEFGVAGSHRRQGIGRRLMDELEKIARREGLRVMVAETQNTNVPAIRFYRAVGFEIDAVDLSYYTNHDMAGGEVAIFVKRKFSSQGDGGHEG